MRTFVILAALIPFAACAPQPQAIQFIPSKKSAVELRSAQSRLVQGDANAVMRGVIGTLHDLGYRITKAEPDAGTVSAIRQTMLRMAVVVLPKSANESVVRANATIVALRQEAQVDSPAFYQTDFFVPLGATLARDLFAVPDTVAAPEAARPAGELNTAKEREAAAKNRAAGKPPAESKTR